MLEIQTVCAGCGDAVLVPAISLVIAMPSADTDGDPEVLHGCPGCGAATTVAVDWRVATFLVHDGATVAPALACVAESPAEFADPVRCDPRALSLDDLLELHELLSRPGWLAQVTSAD